jgi:hypothetical protein
MHAMNGNPMDLKTCIKQTIGLSEAQRRLCIFSFIMCDLGPSEMCEEGKFYGYKTLMKKYPHLKPVFTRKEQWNTFCFYFKGFRAFRSKYRPKFHLSQHVQDCYNYCQRLNLNITVEVEQKEAIDGVSSCLFIKNKQTGDLVRYNETNLNFDLKRFIKCCQDSSLMNRKAAAEALNQAKAAKEKGVVLNKLRAIRKQVSENSNNYKDALKKLEIIEFVIIKCTGAPIDITMDEKYINPPLKKFLIESKEFLLPLPYFPTDSKDNLINYSYRCPYNSCPLKLGSSERHLIKKTIATSQSRPGMKIILHPDIKRCVAPKHDLLNFYIDPLPEIKRQLDIEKGEGIEIPKVAIDKITRHISNLTILDEVDIKYTYTVERQFNYTIETKEEIEAKQKRDYYLKSQLDKSLEKKKKSDEILSYIQKYKRTRRLGYEKYKILYNFKKSLTASEKNIWEQKAGLTSACQLLKRRNIHKRLERQKKKLVKLYEDKKLRLLYINELKEDCFINMQPTGRSVRVMDIYFDNLFNEVTLTLDKRICKTALKIKKIMKKDFLLE